MCYYRGEVVQGVTPIIMVELPYGKLDKYYMQFLMPTIGDAEGFFTTLSMTVLNTIDIRKKTGEMTLLLPRFSIAHQEKLNDVLQRMGITTVFTCSADLSGFTTTERLQISKVVQDAHIDVDEEGTVAAAATGVVVDGASETDLHMVFGKPFVFLLRERESGTIIVAGKVASVQQ